MLQNTTYAFAIPKEVKQYDIDLLKLSRGNKLIRIPSGMAPHDYACNLLKRWMSETMYVGYIYIYIYCFVLFCFVLLLSFLFCDTYYLQHATENQLFRIIYIQNVYHFMKEHYKIQNRTNLNFQEIVLLLLLMVMVIIITVKQNKH